MASFYAELRVGGYTYPVPRCTYAFSQATDARGRVATKVRHGLIELTLDVPDDDFLLAWAAAPYKPLAGCVVFFQDQGGPALETLSWEVGHCVGYQEQFEEGQTGQGAYVCHVTLAAERLTLRPGGPGAYVPPAAGSHGQPGQAAFLGQPSVGPEVLTPFAPLAAEAIISAAAPVLTPLVAAAVAGALAVATVLGLILLSTTPAHAPGLPQPLVSPAELRLRELVAKQAAGTLTPDEEAELIALLAKVKGIHVQRLEDLETLNQNQVGQVSLAHSDLSRLALQHRITSDTWHDGNIAVFEYKDSKGQLHQFVQDTKINTRKHAERLAMERLQAEKIPFHSVTRIYSELEPCELPSGGVLGEGCKRMLSEHFPQAKVTYTYDYKGRGADTKALRTASLQQRAADFKKYKSPKP